ncbi:MAG: tetratricopeptide repeat protein, partial [Rhodothermales bacterium]
LLASFRQKQFGDAERYVRELAAEDREAAESLLSAMFENMQVQDESVERDGLERIFKIWLTFAGDPLDVQQRYADLLIQQGHEEEALEVLETARKEAAAARNARGEASLLLRIGNVHLQHSRYSDALEVFEAALAIEESIGNRHRAAVVRANIGAVHRVRGEYDHALALYEQALVELEETGDRRNAAVVRTHIGDVHEARGEYDHVLALDEQALVEFEEAGDRRIAAIIRARIGLIEGRVQGRSDGIAIIQQAIEELKMLGAPPGAATGHVYIADLTCMQEGAEAARSYLDEHWAFIQQYADADVRAEAFVVRARARSGLGDTAGAMADAREALAFYRAQNVRTALAEEAAQLAGETYSSEVPDVDEGTSTSQ